MDDTAAAAVQEICGAHGRDRSRLIDILRALQGRFGHVPGPAMDLVAHQVGCPRVEVEGVVSFYAFLSAAPQGRVVIRLCDDIIDRMAGAEQVAAAFRAELGVPVGGTTADGAVSLTRTACIGMCDQAPAALVNDVVVTSLNTDRVRQIVQSLRRDPDPRRLVRQLGDGNNAHPLVQAMVNNNIRHRGPVVFDPHENGAAQRKALAMTSTEVIRAVNTARLRGRGGAGFPTGMKWQFTRAAEGDRKFIIGNADEGEPGTFKDRVILTECPDLMFEGMAIAGYAVGAREGILYLRGEYAYLRPFLEQVLADRRAQGLLGARVCDGRDFGFDIRIQLGAGAYICGEETALINSCEGRRGDPRNRPPFPAQAGYLGCPTVVNNVETFCCVARILDRGPGWFSQLGSEGSTGTKLLSVSGDCMSPGVYEVDFGTSLGEVVDLVGAEEARAVQVGGPSGRMVGAADFGRRICYDDLATGGSLMVFGPERDLLEVVHAFTAFFIDESCGYCTPCRVGNVLLQKALENVMAGRATMDDLTRLQELARTVKTASRCGLGQTSPNPVLTTLEAFREEYEARVLPSGNGLVPAFDLQAAVSEAAALAGRRGAHRTESTV